MGLTTVNKGREVDLTSKIKPSSSSEKNKHPPSNALASGDTETFWQYIFVYSDNLHNV